MAKALKIGFKDLYERNEFVHDLPKEKLSALVTQITGAEKDSRVVSAIVGTFNNLKAFANFEDDATNNTPALPDVRRQLDSPPPSKETPTVSSPSNVDLKLSYTINLNLPETTNPEVFNAIFKSLKENLLKE